MTTTISEGTRRARIPHQCFHCGRDIALGATYGFQTNKYDYVYTICWHLDCEALASECRRIAEIYGDDEGWDGLREQWCSSGEYYAECENWRGFYPHVIARMELSDQLRTTRKETPDAE